MQVDIITAKYVLEWQGGKRGCYFYKKLFTKHEVQVWHLSIRLKLRHHYIKFVSIFFSFSVSLFTFCPSLFKILPIPGKRRFAPQTCNVREMTAFFRYTPPPPLYRFHTPGSILPLLRLYERGHLAGMRFIMKSSLSLEDSRPERVGKKVCLYR